MDSLQIRIKAEHAKANLSSLCKAMAKHNDELEQKDLPPLTSLEDNLTEAYDVLHDLCIMLNKFKQ